MSDATELTGDTHVHFTFLSKLYWTKKNLADDIWTGPIEFAFRFMFLELVQTWNRNKFTKEKGEKDRKPYKKCTIW